jgi:hypothetical protein
MNSHTTRRFREAFRILPPKIRRQARQAYKLFQQNPAHPSLHFKRVHPSQPIYSVRINIDYRALGVKDGDEIAWFWIGIHADYDKLLLQSDVTHQPSSPGPFSLMEKGSRTRVGFEVPRPEGEGFRVRVLVRNVSYNYETFSRVIYARPHRNRSQALCP